MFVSSDPAMLRSAALDVSIMRQFNIAVILIHDNHAL